MTKTVYAVTPMCNIHAKPFAHDTVQTVANWPDASQMLARITFALKNCQLKV